MTPKQLSVHIAKEAQRIYRPRQPVTDYDRDLARFAAQLITELAEDSKAAGFTPGFIDGFKEARDRAARALDVDTRKRNGEQRTFPEMVRLYTRRILERTRLQVQRAHRHNKRLLQASEDHLEGTLTRKQLRDVLRQGRLK
jgi:hypothetical protein